jgi:hypothetical protein
VQPDDLAAEPRGLCEQRGIRGDENPQAGLDEIGLEAPDTSPRNL